MKRFKIINLSMAVCWTIIIFLFISIIVRFFTRQILVEMFHWDNTFTHIVFIGNENMNKTPDEESEISVEVDWAALYPFDKFNLYEKSARGLVEFTVMSRFKEKILNIEEKIEAYTTDKLIGYIKLTTAAKSYNRLIGSPDIQVGPRNTTQLIYLKNGYLTYEEEAISSQDIDEIAESVSDFSKFLDEKNIPFIYANAGSKVCPYDKELPAGAEENTNENGDSLLKALISRKVNTIDFRKEIENAGLDWYSSYYKTDHHWKTTTGLWAAKILASYLNVHHNFDFDLSLFSDSAYRIEPYENFFLGGQGRIATLANCQLESYEKILPKYETNFSLTIPTKNLSLSGTYDDVLFDAKAFNSIFEYTESDYLSRPDAYHVVRVHNDALSQIVNRQPQVNERRKLLIIQDSFSWYSTTFLAGSVSEIDVIYPMAFDGSIRRYVEEYEPDIVIMMYCERNIDPIDWTTHKSPFDLR